MRPVRLLIRVTAAATVASAGTVQRQTSVMANTKQASHVKKAISPNQSTDRGGRAPFFLILRRERASKRASREGGPEVHELVSEQAYERFASKQALMCPQSSAASGGTSRMSASKPRTDEL